MCELIIDLQIFIHFKKLITNLKILLEVVLIFDLMISRLKSNTFLTIQWNSKFCPSNGNWFKKLGVGLQFLTEGRDQKDVELTGG